MTRSEMLREMADYTTLLRQNALRDLQIEKALKDHETTVLLVEPFEGLFRQRQREYSLMLRMMHHISRIFQQGGDWLSRHAELGTYKQNFDARWQPLDATIMPMYRTVRSPN